MKNQRIKVGVEVPLKSINRLGQQTQSTASRRLFHSQGAKIEKPLPQGGSQSEGSCDVKD